MLAGKTARFSRGSRQDHIAQTNILRFRKMEGNGRTEVFLGSLEGSRKVTSNPQVSRRDIIRGSLGETDKDAMSLVFASRFKVVKFI